MLQECKKFPNYFDTANFKIVVFVVTKRQLGFLQLSLTKQFFFNGFDLLEQNTCSFHFDVDISL